MTLRLIQVQPGPVGVVLRLGPLEVLQGVALTVLA